MKHNILICLMLASVLSIGVFSNISFAAELVPSAGEQQYIDDVLSKLSFGMTKEEVAEVINQQYSDTGMRIDWHPPHAGQNSRVQAYFMGGKLAKIVWLKMTGFLNASAIYERVADEYR